MTTRPGAWHGLAASGGLGRFVLICLGVYLHAADTLVTATLVPAIVADVGGVAYVGWTIALYQMGAIIAGSATAMLCGRYSIRSVLAGAALAFAIGCLVAALAPTMAVLLVGRLAQGIGGGMLVALTSVAIQQSYAEHLWGRLFGIVAIIWSAGSLTGPLIGGVFEHVGTWRLAFWFFALQAAGLGVLATAMLAGPSAPATATGRWSPLPLVVLSVATLAVAQAAVTAETAVSALECAAGLGLLWFAARLDRRADARMLPVEALDLRHPIGRCLLVILALSVASTGFWSYGPLILKAMFGTDPLVAGYMLASGAVAWTVGTVAVARIDLAAAGMLIRIGATLVFLGGAGFTLAVPSGSFAAIVLCAMLQGGGFGMCWPSLVYVTVCHANGQDATLAAAAPGTVQRIGYSIGAAATGIAANAAGLVDGVSARAAEVAATWVFVGFIPVFAVGLIAGWLTPRRTTRPKPQTA